MATTCPHPLERLSPKCCLNHRIIPKRHNNVGGASGLAHLWRAALAPGGTIPKMTQLGRIQDADCRAVVMYGIHTYFHTVQVGEGITSSPIWAIWGSNNTGNDAQQNLLISLLRHLITIEVTPKGEKTASSTGLGLLGTGMMMGCTNEAWTMDRELAKRHMTPSRLRVTKCVFKAPGVRGRRQNRRSKLYYLQGREQFTSILEGGIHQCDFHSSDFVFRMRQVGFVC